MHGDIYLENVEQSARGFERVWIDVVRLFRASKTSAAFVVGLGIALGVFPYIAASAFGHFVNAALGSRGIGTLTSEASGAMWSIAALPVIFFAFWRAVLSLSGVALSVTRRVASIALVLSLSAYLVGTFTGGVVLVLAALLAEYAFAHLKYARIVAAILAYGIGVCMCGNTLLLLSARALTLGEAISLVLASMTLATFIAVHAFRTSVVQ